MKSAAGSLLAAKPGRLLKDQGSPAVRGRALLCMSPNVDALGQAAPGLGELRLDQTNSRGLFPPE